MKRVAFQGERGAFSEDAVLKFFGSVPPVPHLVPLPTLAEAFQAVETRSADHAVVPIENSQAGSINETYDLLLRSPLLIAGELTLAVNHCLMALPGQGRGAVRRVFSHPQALAQCDRFLRELGAELVPVYDTAGSAKMIKEQGLLGAAAVASERAAQLYGLEILARNIQTIANNFTRFVVLSREPAPPGERNKTSLVFATQNLPGALYACLGAFATRGINLAKLESRPSREKPWEYIFYLDFEGHVQEQGIQEALRDLEGKTAFVKILGSYPKAQG